MRGDTHSVDISKTYEYESDDLFYYRTILAALTEALLHEENAEHRRALNQLVHFVNEFQTDKRDGVWLYAVTKQGKPMNTSKAHSWKANYHEVRALVKFIEAFLSFGK